MRLNPLSEREHVVGSLAPVAERTRVEAVIFRLVASLPTAIIQLQREATHLAQRAHSLARTLCIYMFLETYYYEQCVINTTMNANLLVNEVSKSSYILRYVSKECFNIFYSSQQYSSIS